MLAAALLLSLAACSGGSQDRPCNVQVTAPQLRIDVSAYRMSHPGAEARICRAALRSEPLPDCPTFRLDTVRGGLVSMFAPPYGMVVSLTLTWSGRDMQTSLRVGGEGGRCGAYTYPLLRLREDGRLVAD